jgi:hypothetical protein
VWNDLSEPLRRRLRENGLLYRRYLYGKRSRINFHKTWRDTFETDDKQVVEKIPARRRHALRVGRRRQPGHRAEPAGGAGRPVVRANLA